MELLDADGQSRRIATRTVDILAPLAWLRQGWSDLMRCPLPGAVHGLAIALFGALLFYFARDRFWLLSGAFSGFMLVAPIVATGLYRISSELGLGRQPKLADALSVWKPNDGRLVIFGLLLALAGTGWVMTSASLITGFADAPVRNPQDFLVNVVLNEKSHLFELWLMLGGVLAAPVFASSVVALPLLLDRKASVFAAVLTSWRAVLDNPAPMALWAAIIMGLTALGMFTALAGLVFVVPWLAHASWHAYRDLVQPAPSGQAH